MTGGRPLRVALLSPCFWPEVRRGAERVVRDLADGLLAHGHRPRLITSHPGPLCRTVEDGLEILRLPRPPHPAPLPRLLEPYVSHVPLAYLALRAGDDDVAHAVYPPDGVAAARWHRVTGRPAVLSYLGIPDPQWLAERHRGDVLRVAMRGCATVAISRHAADVFSDTLGRRPPVIAPGVRTDVFRPAPRRAAVPTILCTAAAEDPRKHVALLVRAFARLRERRPEARLVLSRPRPGTGLATGIPDDVEGVQWRDLDDRAALARAYGEAWTAVLAAPREAFGLVLAEALACGTPVVGFADGGIPEIVDRPGIGRLFDRLEEDALADALEEALVLAGDPETARRCRDRALQLSADAATLAYLDLYERLARS